MSLCPGSHTLPILVTSQSRRGVCKICTADFPLDGGRIPDHQHATTRSTTPCPSH